MTATDALLGRLADEHALEAFVEAWRTGTLPKTEWTHAAHVAVCAFHAWPAVPAEVLLGQMRAGIIAYNDAVGTANTPTSGYHETLTRFWCGVVAATLATAGPPTRLAAVRHAVAALGEARALHAAHYDIDVVQDPAARATWVPPRR